MSYVTLAEFKAYLGGFTTVDVNRDTNLQAALDTAAARIDKLCGRTFTLGTLDTITYRTARKTFVEGTEYGLIVPDIATAAGLVVDHGAITYDEDDLPITTLYSAAPWPEPSVELTRVPGWPSVPDEIVQATKILAARLFRRSASPEGVIGSEQWGVVRLARTDPDVQSLIDPFVLFGGA